eukprot:g24245.t1
MCWASSPLSSYKRWKVWTVNKLLTLSEKVPSTARGAYVYTLLGGKALEAVEHLDPSTYQKDGGEKVLFEILDRRFPQKEASDELSESLTKIFELRAEEGESLKSWVSRASEAFDNLQRKTNVAFPEEALGWLILHRSGLNAEQVAVVLARSLGVLKREEIGKAMRSCYPNFSAPKRRYASAAMVAEETMLAEPSDVDLDGLEPSFEDVELFLADDLLAEAGDPDEVFDEQDIKETLAVTWQEKRKIWYPGLWLWTFNSIIGEETLKEFREMWKVHEFEDPEPIREVNHFRFGNGARETSHSVIPMPVVLGGRRGVIKAALVKGRAPLLISRKAMKTLQAKIDFDKAELTLFADEVKAEETRAEQRFRSTQRLDELQRDLEQYRRDIHFAENRLEELEELQRVAAEKVKAAEEHLTQENFDEASKTSKAELQLLKTQAEDVKKRLKKQNDKVKMLFSIICTIFHECRERRVELPLLETDADKSAMERVLSREQDIEDMAMKDLEAAVRSVQIDFSKLPEDKKELALEDRLIDSKTVEAEYAEQVAELARRLEKLNPNMRAMEQCEVEESKLQEIRNQADVASLESQRILRDFEQVKADRVSRFMKCFRHIEERINPYYRELTSYDGYTGGSAYLDLDDAEDGLRCRGLPPKMLFQEPYNGGITFTACPPGKRFFPMELLSGGERSMASMALLFAMHSFQPPPFMILDEVDAPFDRKNTSSLVNYLKKMKFQCVVISLKDTFFAHSDSIIGRSSAGSAQDRSAQTSGNVSLPLQRLGKLAEEGEVPLTVD